MLTIDLHGMTLEEVQAGLERTLENAYLHRERVVRIIHGKGKHSEVFPVIKSYVRHWLEESEFAREKVEMVFRGEDGSPYTPPNGGETVVLLKTDGKVPLEELSWEEEEDAEARRHLKKIRADKNRNLRRKKFR